MAAHRVDDGLDFASLKATLSERLRGLLEDAEDERWPFVPEEWQYGEFSEAVSIEDLLNSQNATMAIPEKDVLLICLKRALHEGLYAESMAITFLLDRSMYRSGKGEYLQELIGVIQSRSPGVRIAPQIMIRRARILKDQSAIQEADELLKYLIDNFEVLWQFRDQSQLDVCIATCVQIRGQIHYNLGLPVDAATFVVESIDRYRAMKPEPDRKGISSSLGILAEILTTMSSSDFLELSRTCRFENANHPLLEAAAASNEGAFLGRFESLYTVRHLRRSAEAWICYLAQLDERDDNRPAVFKDAIHATQLSIESFGTDLKALTSKEQAHEYISAIFQLFLAHSMAGNDRLAEYAREISYSLYGRYCSPDTIRLDEQSLKKLNYALRQLSLPEFVNNPEPLQRPDIHKSVYEYPTLKEVTETTIQDEDESKAAYFVGEVRLPHSTASAKPRPDSSRHSTESRSSGKSASGASTGCEVGYSCSEDTGEDDSTAGSVHADDYQDPKATTAIRTDNARVRRGDVVVGDKSSLGSGDGAILPESASNQRADNGEKHTDKTRSAGVDDDDVETNDEVVNPGEVVEENGEEISGDTEEESVGSELRGEADGNGEENVEDTTIEAILVKTGDENERDEHPRTADAERASSGIHHANGKGEENLEDNEIVETRGDIPVETDGRENVDEILDTANGEQELAVSKPTDPVNVILGEEKAEGVDSDIHEESQGERDGAPVESGNEFGDAQRDETSVIPDGGTVTGRGDDEKTDEKEGTSTSGTGEHLATTDAAIKKPYMKLIQSQRRDETTETHIETKIQPFKTYRARIFKYDVVVNSWSYHDTLVYVESALKIPKNKEGNHRAVVKLKFLSQDEPRAQYIGKRYSKCQVPIDDYFDDVRIQMIARYYVAIFNDRLKSIGSKTDYIQIVPALHMQIMSDDGREILDYVNVEPYIYGNFVKLTNNTDDVNDKVPTDAATAYSHFTYDESGGKIVVVDLQGWVPPQRKTTIILTDPCINSLTEKPFSDVDMRAEGVRMFWEKQHPECNEVCRALGLDTKRPDAEARS